jgi:DivIVA domain-containing protein
MGQLLLLTIGALVIGAIGFGIAVLISGSDPGLRPVEPEGRAVPLPADRPLAEVDLTRTRFDTALRGYRMDQVDAAIRRAAYDVGYKQELIGVLEAEVAALRDGRQGDADTLRDAREVASHPIPGAGREPAAGVTPPAAAGPPAAAAETPADAAEADGDAAEADGAAAEADGVAGEDRTARGDGAAARHSAGPDIPSHQPQEMRLS